MTNAKTLCLSLKVSDQFSALLCDQDDVVLADYVGVVPDFMPGKHYRDYVLLDIDIATGKITNWKVPTEEQLQALIDAGRK